jgi:hypothetical protein
MGGSAWCRTHCVCHLSPDGRTGEGRNDIQHRIFISLTSVLLQGTTIPVVAKWLLVSLPARVKHVTAADILLSEPMKLRAG